LALLEGKEFTDAESRQDELELELDDNRHGGPPQVVDDTGSFFTGQRTIGSPDRPFATFTETSKHGRRSS